MSISPGDGVRDMTPPLNDRPPAAGGARPSLLPAVEGAPSSGIATVEDPPSSGMATVEGAPPSGMATVEVAPPSGMATVEGAPPSGMATVEGAPPSGITAVAGVRVAHVTLGGDEDEVRTGVTCVLPHRRDLLEQPVTAAVHVVNGYGKPVGLAQVAELGEIETPVVLTNTLAVGAAHEGVVRSLMDRHPGLGRPRTVNPVVLECNDGRLNDLRSLAVRPEHVAEAIRLAEEQPDGHGVEQGAVGAGRGMVAFGWKGGIGTASVRVADRLWPATLGCLVLTNMGRPEDLVVHGRRVGGPGRDGGDRDPHGPADAHAEHDPEGPSARSRAERASEGPSVGSRAEHDHSGPPAILREETAPVDGSVIVLLATDAPLDSRQLGRLARRAQNGLARTGVVTDHGSGEFVLAWSTATPHHRRDGDWLRPWFAAVADVVEEAVLSSLRHAVTVTGREGLRVERCPAV